MAKYNAIMDRITLKEEVGNQILEEIAAYFEKRRAIRRKQILSFAGLAAATVLILVLAGPLIRLSKPAGSDTDSQQGMQSVYDRHTHDSLKELEKHVGFTVKLPETLPYEAGEISYASIGTDLAEVNYTGADDQLSFRQSSGTDDNSGIYDTYPVEKIQETEGLQVTLKGYEDRLILAVWTDGSYAYSLYDENGISEEAMLTMIREIAGQ